MLWQKCLFTNMQEESLSKVKLAKTIFFATLKIWMKNHLHFRLLCGKIISFISVHLLNFTFDNVMWQIVVKLELLKRCARCCQLLKFNFFESVFQSAISSFGMAFKTSSQCLKFTEKVAFNIASEASYVYILRGQKFLKMPKMVNFAGFRKTEVHP